MITIKNLFKNYAIGKEKLAVLQDINLEIKQGEFICILGASGCGKSTLLNVVGGLDHDMEGKFFLGQEDTDKFREKEWVRFRKQSVGFIFQNFNLIPHLNALENVELAMKFNGSKVEFRKEKAAQLLKMVGLEERTSYLPSQLSGGQKQRVAIARALANNPRMILADEPTGALDSKSADDVMEILRRINQEKGVTVVMVTHNRELANQADQIVCMKDGAIEKIVEGSGTENVRDNRAQKEAEKAGKMSLLSAVQVGVKNIRLKKKRSLLTVFGTAVGIIGMVLMIGIGIGADDKIHHELRSFVGDETIWVTHEDEKLPMEQKDMEQLKSIQGAETVLDNDLFISTFYYNNMSVEGQMDALGPIEQATSYEQTMADKGSIPKADNSREIVLTSQTAEALVGKNADTNELIGEEITVLTRLILKHMMTYEVETKLTVVGIRDTGLISGASFIPYETAQKLAGESAGMKSAPQKGAEVRVAEGASYDEVVEAIRGLEYKVTTNKEDFASINTLIFALKAFLVFVAGIAMLVSGIMIKIVLQTNVVERTKEIGIMCAIGAGKKEVKRIFVVEAAILGVLSGFTGIAVGQILGNVLNIVLRSKFSVMDFSLYQMNLKSVLLCFAVSVAIAAWAGKKPAKRAAKIPPAEALRYE